MPRPIKKRQVKKTRNEGQDIYAALQRATAGRRKLLIASAAAVIVLIVVVGGVLLYRGSQRKKFDEYNYNGYKLYYSLYQKTPLPPGQRLTQALESFQKAYAIKKNPYSLYYIGATLYELGRYDDAVKAFKELGSRFPDSWRYIPLTYYKIAMADLRMSRNDEALKYLDSLSNYKSGAFRDLALYESGRVLEGMGRKEEARKMFERLKKEFPESSFSKALEPPKVQEKK
jgi:tetratricopeptide (TPR) repeat protein